MTNSVPPPSRFPWYGPALFAVGTIVAVGLLVTQFYMNSSQHRHETIAADLASMDSAIQANIKGNIEFLNILAEDFAESKVERKNLGRRLDKYLKSHPEVTSISLYDAQGSRKWKYPITLMDPTAPGLMPELKGKAFNEMLNQEDTAISAPYTNASGHVVFSIFVPVIYNLSLSHGISCEVRIETMIRQAIKGSYFEKYALKLLSEAGQVVLDFSDPVRELSHLEEQASLGLLMDLEMKLVRYSTPVNLPVLLLMVICGGLALALGVAMWVLGRDNWHRRQIQFELESAKEAAESANKAKTQLIASISHELRTPLGAIQGYTDLLQRTLDGSTPKATTELTAIKRNSDLLLELVDELLDLSKLEAGLLEVNKEWQSLQELIEDSLDIAQFQAASKGLFFQVEKIGALPRFVHFDSKRFRQIVINLTGNAIKFTDEGGINVKIQFETNREELVVDIEDTGIGIPDNLQSKLFQPFTQADQTISRKFGGSGLGLSIAKRMANAVGGDVELKKSQLGVGSVFEVRLPMSTSEESTGKIASTQPTTSPHLVPRLQGKKILIAEDCEDNQVIYRQYLESEGATVVVAHDGHTALKQLENSFDLIITDIQMPGMDGYELARSIRDHGFLKPVMALTAHAMKGERERCLTAGCNTYLTKPINADNFVQAVVEQIYGGQVDYVQPSLVSLYANDPRVQPLLPQFVAKLPDRLEAMGRSLDSRELGQLRVLAHKLKGTAYNYGFPALAEELGTLEQLSSSNAPNFTMITDAFNRLQELVRLAKATGS